jgi:hypothetical protein
MPAPLRLLVVLTLGGVALTAARARDGLREIVHPNADLPAFRCLVPENWTSEVDATGNLQLANATRTAFCSLSFAHTPNPSDAHDALARAVWRDAVNPPWDSREPAEISGQRGYLYKARVKSGNATVRAELIIVTAGDRHLASFSTLLTERIKPADVSTARLVQAAVKLLVAP